MITRGNSEAGATFSNCEKYRYSLWRIWDEAKPRIAFVMLNPSTADENVLDPTVTRCRKRAETLGCGSFEVVNIFALRSTDPKALYESPEPCGAFNDPFIRDAAIEADIVICAWGTHGHYQRRGLRVLGMLSHYCEEKIHYLKLNKDGSPAHPLYLAYALQPTLWSIE